jgi:cytochrome c-type biogenesis protein CcmH/NrfG
MLLAQCLNKQNHPEKGEEMIRRHLFNDPHHISSLIILTESLLMQSRTIDAEEALSKANELDIRGQHRATLQKLGTYINKSYKEHLVKD